MMFGWLSFREGLPLWWSYQLNRSIVPAVEETFEGIARNRASVLYDWSNEQWSYLEQSARDVARTQQENWPTELKDHLAKAEYFTELFVVNANLQVMSSTYSNHTGTSLTQTSTTGHALSHVAQTGRRLLFGPYLDPLTVDVGARTSHFHDEVTILFIQPFMNDSNERFSLVGRIPNDVLGDLIQREAGHVYPDSGDNYVFMAESRFDPSVQPGTALSRSRFEDQEFTLGENLKDGVHTKHWGTVKIKNHTEFEIRFTDPATKELHPGVANTIKNGHNLFVQFPGYSDYRHIPVIGKGVTFQLPSSPDVWGMMCEGDLEEVYRRRSVVYDISKWFICLMALGVMIEGI